MLPSRCLLISFKIVHSLNHLCFSTPYPKPLHPPKHNIPSINLAHHHHHGHPNRHRPCLRHGIPIRCPQPRRQSHRCKSYPTLIHSQPSPIPVSHPPPISQRPKLPHRSTSPTSPPRKAPSSKAPAAASKRSQNGMD